MDKTTTKEIVTQDEVKLWIVNLGINTPLDSWYLSERALVKEVYVNFKDEKCWVPDIESLLDQIRDEMARVLMLSGLKKIHYDWRGVVFEVDPREKEHCKDLWNNAAVYGIDPKLVIERAKEAELNKKAEDKFDE